MRVLLIEDDGTIAQSIELMLKFESFNVYTTDLGEDVRTPLGAFRVAFWRGQDHMLGIPVGGAHQRGDARQWCHCPGLSALRDESASAASSTALRLLGAKGLSSPPPDRIQT